MPAIPESIWNTLVTGVLLIGSFLFQRWFQQRDKEADAKREAARRAEEHARADDRWYAEFFMKVQIEGLTNLQRSLLKIRVAIFTLIIPTSTDLSSTLKEASANLRLAQGELLDAATLVSSYVPPKVRSTVSDTMTVLQETINELSQLGRTYNDLNPDQQKSALAQLKDPSHPLMRLATALGKTVPLVGAQLHVDALRASITRKPNTEQ